MRRCGRLLTTCMLVAWSGTAAAQAPPDLSGMWLVRDPGSGSFTEWYNNVPKPRLRPDIVKDNAAIAAREAAGEVVNKAPPRELPGRQPADDDGLVTGAQHRPGTR